MKYLSILKKLKNQYMKRKNNIWLYIIFFLSGSLVSYLLTEFNYLEIDYKVNITSSIISITSATIALYLAISLKKNQTQSSNLHSYLQPKLDTVWKLFLTLSHNLSLNDSIELKELTKSIKEISQNITPLKKMFNTFDINDNSIDKLENAIDDLENFLEACQIRKNIINYKLKKGELRVKLDEIHSLFVVSLKSINNIS